VDPDLDKQGLSVAKALTDLVEDKGKKEDSVRFPDLKDQFWNAPIRRLGAARRNPQLRDSGQVR